MNTSDIATTISDAMKGKGVEQFWIDSAMTYIRRGLGTNRYFATSIADIRITTGSGRTIKSLTATIGRRYPDDNVNDTATLTYTFNPAAKAGVIAHRIAVVAKP